MSLVADEKLLDIEKQNVVRVFNERTVAHCGNVFI